MSFKLEKEMLPVMNNNLKSFLTELQYFNESDIKLKATELPDSYRIIDMVITGIELKADKENLENLKRNLKYLDFVSLSLLAEFCINSSLSIHYINKFYSSDKASSDIILDKLEKLDLIEKVS